jgi:hypothetical protein
VLFATLRTAGGTIWLAHSGFNLAMNAAIFTALTG